MVAGAVVLHVGIVAVQDQDSFFTGTFLNAARCCSRRGRALRWFHASRTERELFRLGRISRWTPSTVRSQSQLCPLLGSEHPSGDCHHT